jgi:uncharacterized membrane protein
MAIHSQDDNTPEDKPCLSERVTAFIASLPGGQHLTEGPHRPAHAWLDPLRESGYAFDGWLYFTNAWECFRRHALLYMGYTLALLALNTVLFLVFRLVHLPQLLSVFNMVFGPVLLAGYYTATLAVLRDGVATKEDFLEGFNRHLVPLLLVGACSGILVGIGSLLLILPGIYLAISYVFIVPLIVDKGMRPWDAMEASRHLVARNFWPVTGFVVGLAVLMVIGALALGLGLLVAMPLYAITIAIAYTEILGKAWKAPAAAR